MGTALLIPVALRVFVKSKRGKPVYFKRSHENIVRRMSLFKIFVPQLKQNCLGIAKQNCTSDTYKLQSLMCFFSYHLCLLNKLMFQAVVSQIETKKNFNLLLDM